LIWSLPRKGISPGNTSRKLLESPGISFSKKSGNPDNGTSSFNPEVHFKNNCFL